MMLLTVADVTLRAAFNMPIRGVYELVELLLAGTFFVALPACSCATRTSWSTSIDDLAPRWVPALKRARGCCSPSSCSRVMAWQGWLAARDSLEFNDVTADLGLPRVWHWIALLVGVIGAAIAALAMALARERPAMSVAAIGVLGVALLLLLIFAARADRGRARGLRACSATPRSTAGRRR